MKKILALLVSTVIILVSGCNKVPQKLTREDLAYERQVYIEDAIKGMDLVKSMDWYEDDFTLVAVTAGYPISADQTSTAEIERNYKGQDVSGKSISVGDTHLEVFFVDADNNYYSCTLCGDGEKTIKNTFGKEIKHIDKRFFVSDRLDCSYERIEKLRQEGDYITEGDSKRCDEMFFFIDAEEILQYSE